MRDHYREISDHYLTRPFHDASNIRMAYLTDMLQELINMGIQMIPVDIWAKWAELDTPQDLVQAKERLQL
jgi:choline kinase